MFVARKLRGQNISAYLIYMFQVEDVIRAFHLDEQRIRDEYLTRFQYSPAQIDEALAWYGNLARMMREEGKTESGHTQVVANTILLAADRHAELLADPKVPLYAATYYKALPYIVELRAQGNNQAKGEIENCLDALYGASLLRMQGKELSRETTAALAPISQLLELLSEHYTPSLDAQ
ncbi:MAG: DUF4924 family protein [Bacteroidaceae bacterium]|nr:DUF4924 family protein [Bacteroidaceae bacterium]